MIQFRQEKAPWWRLRKIMAKHKLQEEELAFIGRSLWTFEFTLSNNDVKSQ
jgi:hypothetical protein